MTGQGYSFSPSTQSILSMMSPSSAIKIDRRKPRPDAAAGPAHPLPPAATSSLPAGLLQVSTTVLALLMSPRPSYSYAAAILLPCVRQQQIISPPGHGGGSAQDQASSVTLRTLAGESGDMLTPSFSAERSSM